MIIQSYTPGKLIFIGEYAVLEGAPALVAAVNRYCKITIEDTDSDFCILSSHLTAPEEIHFKITETGEPNILNTEVEGHVEQVRFVLDVFRYLHQDVHEFPTGLHISIDTTDFYTDTSEKLGLGSSAALTVGVVAVFFRIVINGDYDENDVFNTSIEAHRYAQNGAGSGIDIAAGSYGGVLRYSRENKELQKMPYPEDLHIIPVWTGRSASTRDLLHHLEKRRIETPGRYKELMKSLTGISTGACESFRQGNSPAFLRSVGRYYSALSDLGNFIGKPIISKEHRQIHAVIQRCGGVYKPSGAGLGDVGVAFTDSPAVAENIRNEITASPYHSLNLDVSPNGVTTSEAVQKV